ncbi:MAG TPA: protein kinase [Polyangiaceae bacterium]|nr:protein kinase [Polyangiaceae bacterium]
MNAQPQFIDSKYQIIRQLGQGGMGAVYEARHVGTNRRVAVKVIVSQALAAGPDVVRRFQLEARASGAIDSDHVVQVLDTGVDPATQNPYMVMELLTGEDVQQLIERLGSLAPDLALRILAQACVGLRRAHEAGIVHRDIKSANLFLSRRESGDILVKLLDFGIAKVRADQFAASGDHGLTRTGSMLGSPLYMSPEQAKGAKTLDHRSDIWSLGVVLYEALAGTTPHAECTTIGELILAICAPTMPPLQDRAPWVPPEIAAIVHKALTPDPAARYQSAAEMHAAIMALLPQGGRLHEEMLTAMPPAVRNVTAPRFSVPGADRSGPQSPLAETVAASSPNVVALGQSSPTTTTAGFGASQSVPAAVSRSSPLRWIAPLGAAILVAGSVAGGLALRASRHSNENATAASATPSVTAEVSAKPTSIRTVTLAIAPSDAKVDVDGVAATAQDGKLALSGDIGSVHHVHLAQGSRETTTDVVIAESGAVPSRVELPAPASTAHSVASHGTPPPTVTTKSTAAAAATATQPVATTPPATATTAKTTKTTPTVQRSFE